MRFHALVPSDFSVVNRNVICRGHTPLCGIAPKPGAESVLIEYIHQIFVTPIHISGIESLGAFRISAAKRNIAPVHQKFGNVAVIGHNLGYVPSCFLGDCKSEIIPNKPPQSVKHPTEYLLLSAMNLSARNGSIFLFSGTGFVVRIIIRLANPSDLSYNALGEPLPKQRKREYSIACCDCCPFASTSTGISAVIRFFM